MSWCTIESDPGVFTELIEAFGVKNVCVDEIYSLDSSEQATGKSYGLIFLFKWREESDPRPTLDAFEIPSLFFARQTIQNACATQAILSILLNCDEIPLGSTLQDLKEFTLPLDPESRGFAIGGTDSIREAHNSFARPEPFVEEEDKKSRGKKSDEIFHFVAYIPHQGKVYELDGLKSGPIVLGELDSGSEDWWVVAKPAIEARMARYSASETHFALLTVSPDPSLALTQEKEVLAAQMQAEGTGDEAQIEQLRRLDEIDTQLTDLRERKDQFRRENDRRRHNYIPCIMTLLNVLAQQGKLEPLVEAARNRPRNPSS